MDEEEKACTSRNALHDGRHHLSTFWLQPSYGVGS